MGRPILITLLLLISSEPALSQDKLIELLLEQDSEVSGPSYALEFLEELVSDPLNVNEASVEELLKIPGISLSKAQAIIAERNTRGLFNDLEQVKTAGRINDKKFALIRKLLRINKIISPFEIRIRQRVKQELTDRRGFESDAFSGGPIKNYTRLRIFSPDNYSLGILVEKDPGESNINDHIAGFIDWISKDKTLFITGGDYSLNFAQGLIFSRKFSFGKGNDPVYPVKKRERGGKGFYSSSENEGFRGLYVNYNKSGLNTHFFFSKNKKDARLNSGNMITSLFETGYHRTETEISHKNSTNEIIYGSRIRYNYNNTAIFGFTVSKTKYDNEFINKTPIETPSKFSGDNSRAIGIDYDLYFNNINFYGEAGFVDPGSFGIISGFQMGFDRTAVSILYRNYAEDFYSLNGNGFSNSISQSINEKGFYIGLKQEISNNFDFSFYSDIFKNPGRTATFPFSKIRKEIMMSLNYDFTKTEGMLQWRRKSNSKREKYTNQFGIENNIFEDFNTNRIRIRNDIKINGTLTNQIRLEYQDNDSGFSSERSGVSAMEKLVYRNTDRINITTGVNIFKTGDNIFYIYENDHTGVLNVKQFKGDGYRVFSIISKSIGMFNYSLKYGWTKFSDRSSIGSGHDKINGNSVKEVSFQIDLRYK